MAAASEGESQELLLRQWERRQVELKQQMIDHDTEDWQSNEVFEGLERIGGMDLSYIKGDEVNACASLVVLSYPDLKVVYEECQMVCLNAPYIPGFLAFRETPFLEEAVRRLQDKDPSLLPQVIFADGNGILHHREFGVACHLGVLTDLPCIGVAKNLLHVDGLEEKDLLKEKVKDLQKGGNAFSLTGSSGKVLGMALKSCEKSTKPIYVSVGHRISLDTALRLTHSCCKYRVPEPIRQAYINTAMKLLENPFVATFRHLFGYTEGEFRMSNSPNSTSFRTCGRKPDHPEETHTDTGRTCRPRTDSDPSRESNLGPCKWGKYKIQSKRDRSHCRELSKYALKYNICTKGHLPPLVLEVSAEAWRIAI